MPEALIPWLIILSYGTVGFTTGLLYYFALHRAANYSKFISITQDDAPGWAIAGGIFWPLFLWITLGLAFVLKFEKIQIRNLNREEQKQIEEKRLAEARAEDEQLYRKLYEEALDELKPLKAKTRIK